MATKKKGRTNTGKKVGLSALAAAAAGAAAAGYYFYASKDAKKHRQIAAKWATDMKKDVLSKAKTLQQIDKTKLARIVDEAAASLGSMKSANKEDIAKAVKELKNNWKELAGEVAKKAKSATTKKTKVSKKAK